MSTLPPPQGVTTPGCVEGRRRPRSRSHGSHVDCPRNAVCRSRSSRGRKGRDTSTPSRTDPPPLEASIRRALSKLYDELKGSEKTLSAEGLSCFMQRVQKETPEPWFNEMPSARTYSFPEFCDFWYEHASHSKRPIEPEKAAFDKPMSNYFINSSHNTYIGGGDQVIRRGCRCVEIDVWNSPHCNEAPRSLRPRREQRGPRSQHWSVSSLLSWMKTQFEHGAGADTRQPLNRPPQRALALSNKDWDETLAHEPRVCHCLPTIAGDLSAREGLPFRLVCRAIKDVAFEKTDMPLIISLENHTTDQQQEEMVKIMRSEWQGLLLEDSLPDYHPEKDQPRVIDLRRKILIKGRKKKQKCSHNNAEFAECEAATISSEPSDSGYSEEAKIGSAKHYYRTAPRLTSPSEKQQAKGDKILDALDKLAIYTYSPGPFKSFASKDSNKPAHIFSFGEEKLKALHRTKHKDIFQHNKKYLARTFPASLSAFLSTNPNLPTLFWRKGVQMVALNWQYCDTAMHLNDAMFDDTPGWVLKPPGYQSDSPATDQAHVSGKKKLSLCITVLGGQHIPMPRDPAPDESNFRTSPSLASAVRFGDSDENDFRPRVKCYLHVESHSERNPLKKMSEEEICKETNTAETHHPTWSGSGAKLQFPTVSHVIEELSFVRFSVENCGRIRDQRTAWACIRLDRLQEGYRLINLKDSWGDSTEGTLLVRVEKTVCDEPPRPLSLRAKTWKAYKKGSEEVTRSVSRWSCFSLKDQGE